MESRRSILKIQYFLLRDFQCFGVPMSIYRRRNPLYDFWIFFLKSNFCFKSLTSDYELRILLWNLCFCSSTFSPLSATWSLQVLIGLMFVAILVLHNPLSEKSGRGFDDLSWPIFFKNNRNFSTIKRFYSIFPVHSRSGLHLVSVMLSRHFLHDSCAWNRVRISLPLCSLLRGTTCTTSSPKHVCHLILVCQLKLSFLQCHFPFKFQMN